MMKMCSPSTLLCLPGFGSFSEQFSYGTRTSPYPQPLSRGRGEYSNSCSSYRRKWSDGKGPTAKRGAQKKAGGRTLPPHAPEVQCLGLLRFRSDPVHTAPPQLEAAFHLRTHESPVSLRTVFCRHVAAGTKLCRPPPKGRMASYGRSLPRQPSLPPCGSVPHENFPLYGHCREAYTEVRTNQPPSATMSGSAPAIRPSRSASDGPAVLWHSDFVTLRPPIPISNASLPCTHRNHNPFETKANTGGVARGVCPERALFTSSFTSSHLPRRSQRFRHRSRPKRATRRPIRRSLRFAVRASYRKGRHEPRPSGSGHVKRASMVSPAS